MINKVVSFFALILCFSTAVFAQEYDQLVMEASNSLLASDYQVALELYQQAFQTEEGNTFDLYNAACAAALCENSDLAFIYLEIAFNSNLIETQWLEEDMDLLNLHSDNRWFSLIASMEVRADSLLASLPEDHPEGPLVVLPQPRLSSDVSLEEAMQNRRSVRSYADLPLTIAEVSQLLWSAYGLSYTVENAPDFLRGGLRTAPSAGALYPLELYLVARNVTDLDPGIYWYKSETHELVQIADENCWEEFSNAGFNQLHFETAAAAIVYSAVFERCTEIYGDRGRERYVCMDLGHSAENVYLQAYALEIGTCAIGAFSDLALKQVIRMTRAEVPLYIMPLGKV
ncbi:MAG: SagB/ThcOx family dehydrogenase [Candidatus Aegiribacteria sp.]|nr:SagB/ThcOx family dehydrogenase [Candidatus Aegiribacteria sp.]